MGSDDLYAVVVMYIGIMCLAVAMRIFVFVIAEMNVQRFVFFAVFFVLVHNCDMHGLDGHALNEFR